MGTPRRVTVGLLGAVLLAGCQSTPAPPAATSTDATTPTQATPAAPSGRPGRVAVHVYYVGDTATGPRLFRELTRVDADTRLVAAVQASVDGAAADADYRSAWPSGIHVEGVHVDGIGDDGLLQVDLSGQDVRDRPAAMSRLEAEISVQQVIHTVQDAAGTRAPVQLLVDGRPVDRVLGVPTGDPLTRGPVLETLNLVSLDRPADGAAVRGATLEVTGAANGYEGNVVLELRRADGTIVRGPTPFIAGTGADRLFRFSRVLDVARLAPGAYLLTATTEDPREGHELYQDDRVVIVE